MKIAVAGTGYVGLSLAVLLSQHNEVHALDIVPEKVEKINSYVSPIQDDEIERFLAEAKAGERQLDLHATVEVEEAYAGADYAVIATPTNYDSDRNFFDTSSVEAAIAAVRSVNPDAWIVIKSTSPSATPRACARGWATAKSSSARSSYVRARRSTTTCTPAASWWARPRRTPRPSRRPSASPACSLRAPIQSSSSASTRTAQRASPSSCLAPPRPRP